MIRAAFAAMPARFRRARAAVTGTGRLTTTLAICLVIAVCARSAAASDIVSAISVQVAPDKPNGTPWDVQDEIEGIARAAGGASLGSDGLIGTVLGGAAGAASAEMSRAFRPPEIVACVLSMRRDDLEGRIVMRGDERLPILRYRGATLTRDQFMRRACSPAQACRNTRVCRVEDGPVGNVPWADDLTFVIVVDRDLQLNDFVAGLMVTPLAHVPALRNNPEVVEFEKDALWVINAFFGKFTGSYQMAEIFSKYTLEECRSSCDLGSATIRLQMADQE